MELNNLREIYKGKRVLITGNTGFKGSWLTLWLLKMEAIVVGYSKNVPTDPSIYEACDLSKRITQVWGDIRDSDSLSATINEHKPDYIFHMAAQALVKESILEPLYTMDVNGMGTANLLNILRKVEFKCIVVIITSDKCYENVEWNWGYRENDRLGGKDPYSASKAIAEIVFHSFWNTYFVKHPFITLATTRAGNVIGGGDWAMDRIVPDCIKKWSVKSTVSIRRPKATRPWQHVLEPLGGYLLLGAKLGITPEIFNGESFNFGPPPTQVYCVEELIKDLARHWKLSNAHDLINIEENTSFYEAGLLKLNTDKAFALLAWEPVLNYRDTIEFTGSWYNSFYQSEGGKANTQAYSEKQIDEYLLKAKLK